MSELNSLRPNTEAEQSERLRRLPTFLAIVVVAIVYFIAGKLGLKLAFLNASASPVWPPAGIALAALILLGYRAWPAIFLAAFLVNLTTAGNIETSLGIAAGNTLEAVCGAWVAPEVRGLSGGEFPHLDRL